ncbi:BON domain-containing protein [Xenorhabdus anantnagensis]|uniref:BON domain-containing protein n=1 Tax=Xenorhabdus anantnagensis TaxID=3025875 RepID=A0ABT5LNT2_9GAMM|nr:BON domain-containing protein [Xenorhabdus anantnagensis]MDC9596077.1 BON domain-containing protein [Xenorhabdus anantnagensis]
MNKSRIAHSLVAVVLGSVLVSSSAFANNILSGNTPSSQGTAQKVNQPLKKSEEKVVKRLPNAGNSVNDTQITTAVKDKLRLQKNLNINDILVKTDKGIVYIAGFVKSQAQKTKVVALAKSVKGIKSVRYSLVVVKNTVVVKK